MLNFNAFVDTNKWALLLNIGWYNGIVARELWVSALCFHLHIWSLK